MTHEEEIRALAEKAEELRQVTDKLEEKLAALPYNEKSAPLREMMKKMLGELRRMDKNLQTMISNGVEIETEGGTENGNH